MPKHKTVIKYVVDDQAQWHGGEYEHRMALVTCKFVQSPKRLTLVKSECKAYHDAARAIGFRTYLPVDSKGVHDTPMAALNAAVAEYAEEVRRAESRLATAKADLERVETLRLGYQIDLELAS